MFDNTEKVVALEFARSLANRDYSKAYSMLSQSAQSRITQDQLREQFEAMIPLDWGDVDPIELEENPAWDDMFVYIVLGGDVYSEAIIINSFADEAGSPTVELFEFGRP